VKLCVTSWDYDNSKKQIKINWKAQSLINSILKDEIDKKKYLIKKILELTQVN